MASPKDLVGEIVPRSFVPGFIILSYAVSYVGALSTLELLHRRTSPRGLYNWFLLVGSSITMGACAIWCMHYIGNRAIVLNNGEPELQIAYNSGFTALSFFVPILVLLAAFRTIGCNETVSKVRVGLGGILAGFAICGMHYLGQAGIDHYTCVYSIPFVVGSVIIACVASVTALTIFFVLRAAWTNSWWKRALSAVLLAGAVSGMHWVASTGTQYRLKAVGVAMHSSISRDQTIIIVIILSMSSCVVLLGLAVIAQRRRNRTANRAQQVVLASVTFDSEGRLMVTPEGLLPNQKITNAYVERTFDDCFDTSQPVFHWIFRVSRNWVGVLDLIPSMRRHLQAFAIIKNSRPGSKDSYAGSSSEDNKHYPGDYSVVFRELFCVAASELAEQVNEPLENLGVLYDEILSTGHTRGFLKARHDNVDLEQGAPAPMIFGRGQLLFAVRQTNKLESARLQASGFRFASIQNVLDILARSMQVGREELSNHLQNMRAYASEEQITDPGVYLGCFAIRANVSGGFEVLAQSKAKSQLPSTKLPMSGLEDWHRSVLDQLDGCSASTCMNALQAQMSSTDIKLQSFTTQLYNAILTLSDQLSGIHFMDSLLIAKPVSVPCRSVNVAGEPGEAFLIAFQMIVSIQTRTPSSQFEFSPLRFFRTQQYVSKDARDHHLFARKIRQEFAPVLNRVPHQSVSQRVSSKDVPRMLRSKGTPGKSWFGRSNAAERQSSVVNPDNSSEKHLVDSHGLGGILVSQEISVDVRELAQEESDVELQDMATTIGIDTAEIEDSPTYVDQLFAVCIEGRQARL
ncbi:MAG: hypothetical protein M4579_001187 [Chaenotheca gracillima]|nr:MAG: hypothetical protein M4579_001187 [Chaenotheca gracillima]